ncbi:MAG: hypothetical protein A3F84_27795 [Candidatus Handelsmanbacteria bacterium RIFCSPLOWO2_12_FULL_64_10]|uniref:Uncharacterized protein n=1 Tax=Handelsmanbacteria sp. (strain RIFCSPLOWO2_12_FULL_64_10) TaxID=1817868 RepID=A0A1F6C5G9_HANXR|nr:MAG: hypothetical protein A3F84_27795 [Candidatus Handelsmanbacteria bacterium RIFCSPLOWO2_12_FULL_64_10]
MAITSVDEIWSGRRGAVDDSFKREYERKFRIIADSTNEDAITVTAAMAAEGILMWGPYMAPNGSFDLFARCNQIEAEQSSDSPFIWEGRASYSSDAKPPDDIDPKTGGQNSQEENPLLRPPTISISTGTERKAAIVDRDGNKLVNSVGDQFDPPIEIDEPYMVLSISRNVLAINNFAMAWYIGTVNDSPFFGYPAEHVRLMSWSASSHYENNVFFWDEHFEFHAKGETLFTPAAAGAKPIDYGWGFVLLDQGFNELDANNLPKLMRDQDGQPYSHTILLNGAGAKLAAGQPPVYLLYYAHKKKDFSVFNLPTPNVPVTKKIPTPKNNNFQLPLW